MKADLHTLRVVTQHVDPKPYVNGLYVWKCRSCDHTIPDQKHIQSPVLCPHCGSVMDWTPIRRTA